jgi:3'-phosphoadenosine 5'-phosphosulfate sulfotransferase (PAPS reductase)/FAD synthetase
MEKTMTVTVQSHSQQGVSYTVNLTENCCSCPDYQHRRKGTNQDCKHLIEARKARRQKLADIAGSVTDDELLRLIAKYRTIPGRGEVLFACLCELHDRVELAKQEAAALPPLAFTDEIRAELAAGAVLAVGISGGKDSQALLTAVVREHRANRWPGELFAIHADLGRAEWEQTLPHCQALCDRLGVRLVVVRREKGDLVDRWQERLEKLAGTGKPFWSSAQARYCTSDMKRGPIDKYLRQFPRVISVEGIRADESTARAKKPVSEVRDQITTRERRAFTWNPLLYWNKEDVWAACGTSHFDLQRRQSLYREGREEAALSGWPCHPAYVFGNERLSCALCVLASKNDLVNGAKHNPALYQTLVAMEERSGFSFRADLALSSLPVFTGATPAPPLAPHIAAIIATATAKPTEAELRSIFA